MKLSRYDFYTVADLMTMCQTQQKLQKQIRMMMIVTPQLRMIYNLSL